MTPAELRKVVGCGANVTWLGLGGTAVHDLAYLHTTECDDCANRVIRAVANEAAKISDEFKFEERVRDNFYSVRKYPHVGNAIRKHFGILEERT